MRQDNNSEIEKKYETLAGGAKIPVAGYVTLISGFLILSGLLASTQGGIGAFDFNSLNGNFGTIKNAANSTFIGSGGTGAKQGFIFALTLIPGIMLSLGIMSIVEQTGGLKVAQKCLTPIMRPLFGLPGCSSLAMIASMQSTDAGASLTKVFYERGDMSNRERIIFTQYELSGSAAINNYITIGSAAFCYLVVPMGVPLLIILIMKVVGANLSRFILRKFYTEENLAD